MRRARDAYLLEKKAHETTKNEVQWLREQVAELKRRLGTTENGEGWEVGSDTNVGGYMSRVMHKYSTMLG